MSVGKHSLVYIGFNILQKSISFVLLPVLTYFITKAGIGKITLLTTLVPALSIYCGLALYGAGTVFTYKLKNELEVKQFWGNINLLSNIFGLIFSLILLLFYAPLHKLIFENLAFTDYRILLIIVFFSCIYNQYQAFLQAHKKVREFTQNAISFSLINTLLVLFYIIILHSGYRGYFYALLITNSIFYCYAMWYAYRNYIFKIDLRIIKSCLKYSIPLLPHLTFGLMLAYTDRFFVNKYLGISELGVYGVACQFAVIFSLIVDGFIRAYSSFSFENLQKRDYTAIINFCHQTLVIFSIMVIIVSTFAHEIFWIIVKKDFIDGWQVLPLFAFAYMFNLSYVFFVNNIFYHKPWLVNLITISSGTLNVILNFVLTKKYGMVGATLSTVISYWVSMLVAYYLSNSLLRIGFRLNRIIMFQINVIFIGSLTYVIHVFKLSFIHYLVLDMIVALCGVLLIINYFSKKILRVNMNFSLKYIRI